MSYVVPFVLSQEVNKGGDEQLSCVDGTTRLGEAVAIVVRFVDTDFDIHQRLVCMLQSACEVDDRGGAQGKQRMYTV